LNPHPKPSSLSSRCALAPWPHPFSCPPRRLARSSFPSIPFPLHPHLQKAPARKPHRPPATRPHAARARALSEPSGTPTRRRRHGRVLRVTGGGLGAGGGVPGGHPDVPLSFPRGGGGGGRQAGVWELRPPLREAGVRQPPREHLARPGALRSSAASFLPCPHLPPNSLLVDWLTILCFALAVVSGVERDRWVMRSFLLFVGLFRVWRGIVGWCVPCCYSSVRLAACVGPPIGTPSSWVTLRCRITRRPLGSRYASVLFDSTLSAAALFYSRCRLFWSCGSNYLPPWKGLLPTFSSLRHMPWLD
jgi:hypothetical protein